MSRSRRVDLLILFIGVIVGALVAAAIRHIVYIGDGREPNVHPGMAYYAFPVLALPLALLAALVHAVCYRFITYAYGWQWLLAGSAYGLWFLAFLGPAFLVLILVLNPWTFRLLQVVITRVSTR